MIVGAWPVSDRTVSLRAAWPCRLRGLGGASCCLLEPSAWLRLTRVKLATTVLKVGPFAQSDRTVRSLARSGGECGRRGKKRGQLKASDRTVDHGDGRSAGEIILVELVLEADYLVELARANQALDGQARSRHIVEAEQHRADQTLRRQVTVPASRSRLFRHITAGVTWARWQDILPGARRRDESRQERSLAQPEQPVTWCEITHGRGRRWLMMVVGGGKNRVEE
eukprot:760267-Hanusia_phi.AAC.1